jgi:hypothetical protein
MPYDPDAVVRALIRAELNRARLAASVPRPLSPASFTSPDTPDRQEPGSGPAQSRAARSERAGDVPATPARRGRRRSLLAALWSRSRPRTDPAS